SAFERLRHVPLVSLESGPAAAAEIYRIPARFVAMGNAGTKIAARLRERLGLRCRARGFLRLRDECERDVGPTRRQKHQQPLRIALPRSIATSSGGPAGRHRYRV